MDQIVNIDQKIDSHVDLNGERALFIRLDSVKKEHTKEGFYKFYNVKVARSGNFNYGFSEVEHDGAAQQGYKKGQILKAYRPKETFTNEVINSIQGMPVTLHHPRQGLANPENIEAEGAVTGPAYVEENEDGEYDLIVSEITFYSKKLISAYKQGMRELSIGYFYKKPVEWVINENFNFIEYIIKINHLALVDKGRAGYGYRLHNNFGENSNMDEKLDKLFETISGAAASMETVSCKISDLVRINEEMMKEKSKDNVKGDADVESKSDKDSTSREDKSCEKSKEKSKHGKDSKSSEDDKGEDGDDVKGDSLMDNSRKNDVFMSPTDFGDLIKSLSDNAVWGYAVGDKKFTSETPPKVMQLFKDEASARNLSKYTGSLSFKDGAEKTRGNSTNILQMIAVGD